jgi:hypothetical protein
MISKTTVRIILGLAIGELAFTVIFHALGSGSFGNYSIPLNYIFAGLLFLLFYWFNSKLPPTVKKYTFSWIHWANLFVISVLTFYYLEYSKYLLRGPLFSLLTNKPHWKVLYNISIYILYIVVPLIIILVDLKFILKTIPRTVWGITLFILLFYMFLFFSVCRSSGN